MVYLTVDNKQLGAHKHRSQSLLHRKHCHVPWETAVEQKMLMKGNNMQTCNKYIIIIANYSYLIFNKALTTVKFFTTLIND